MSFRFVLFALAPLAALVAFFAAPQSARAGDGVVPQHEKPKPNLYAPDAGIDEKIGSIVPMDLTLRDENDQAIALGAAIGGKPTILVPVYYRCPMLCTKVLNGVLEACRQMPTNFSVGAQFNIVTVSMDPMEHGDLARAKKYTYLHGEGGYGRSGADAGWRFLTGTKENINALLGSIGYKVEFDKMLKEYNHPSGIVILSPQGKVTRYFYGIGYDGEFEISQESAAWASKPKPELTEAEESDRKSGRRQFTKPTTTLRLSLIEAAEGQGGSLFDKISLVCYRYDALHQGYALQIIWLVRIGGIITLLLVGAGVTIAARREGVLNSLLWRALVFCWMCGMFTTLTLYKALPTVYFVTLFTLSSLVGLAGYLMYRRTRRAETLSSVDGPVNGAPVSPSPSPSGGTA
jgi:protein SCO1/2